MGDATKPFATVSNRAQIREILSSVYDSLMLKGYNPINQLVGYILSEDPTYITNYNNARSLICRIDRDELKKVLNVGVPIALQETTVQISFLVINSIINGMGLMPSAGYGVAQKLTSFIMLIPSSVMQSVSAFVAQNTGAGKKDRAWKGFLTAIATGCSLGVVIFCIGFFGGSVISRIFTSDPAVIEQSAAYLRGFAPECILTCVLFSSIGYFNGRGISIPVMIQGITSACLIRIPLALFFSHLPNTNLTFVGMSTPITTVYGICFFMICFARLKKKGQM